MITDAVLYVLTAFLDLIGELFPVADMTSWPADGTALGDWFGETAGPFNRILPISEMVAGVNILVLIWFPAVMVYEGVTWAYRHLPVIGAG